MKYYFVQEKNRDIQHVVTARDEGGLLNVLADAGVAHEYFYELTSETFDKEGFLFTRK